MAIPTTHNGLRDWATGLLKAASAAPAEYGFTPQQIADYQVALDRYVDLLEQTKTLSTRTQVLVEEKNKAMNALLNASRTLYGVADKWPLMTDAKRLTLGIAVRKARVDRPAPTTRPNVHLVSVRNHTITVAVHDDSVTSKRVRPKDVTGVWFYTFIGQDYPSDPALWDFQGATSRSTFEIAFDDTVPAGTKIWITAVWINAKQEPGPVAVPISTNLQGGGSEPDPDLKVAA